MVPTKIATLAPPHEDSSGSLGLPIAAATTPCPHCSIPAPSTVIKLSNAIHNSATSSMATNRRCRQARLGSEGDASSRLPAGQQWGVGRGLALDQHHCSASRGTGPPMGAQSSGPSQVTPGNQPKLGTQGPLSGGFFLLFQISLQHRPSPPPQGPWAERANRCFPAGLAAGRCTHGLACKAPGTRGAPECSGELTAGGGSGGSSGWVSQI